jgi:hypothetical protein
MVVVEDSELEMHSVDVTFANKEKYSPPLKHYFRENGRTRAIDLPGNTRKIKSVAFRYANLPGGGKARVQLWGRAGHASPSKPAKARWNSTVWTLLGDKRVEGKRIGTSSRSAGSRASSPGSWSWSTTATSRCTP